MDKRHPSYLSLYESGELQERAERAIESLSSCSLCPRNCKVDRLQDNKHGLCRTGRYATVVSHTPHFGEEPGISGSRGSGTIFFGYCNLRCKFCQNHQISQPPKGKSIGHEVDPKSLAKIMIDLQEQGCHNINLVSPSHVVAQFLEALPIAVEMGLEIPIVYNTNAYDSQQALRLLDGIVDIYLPDFKYTNSAHAAAYSGAKDYPQVATQAILEMYRQVGYPVFDSEGILLKGLVIRHLVLPNGKSDTPSVLEWIAQNIGTKVFISLMAQYFPTFKAIGIPELSRPIVKEEYEEALDLCIQLGLENGWFQEFSASEYYRPDFEDESKPFKDIDDFV